MTLLEKIEKDFHEAMKAHDAARVSTLRVLLASVKNAAIAARTSAKKVLDDADVETVVKQESKKIKDALVDFSKAARQDLIDASNAELKILASYMPEQMSAQELAQIAKDTVEELANKGVKEFGKVMGAVMAKVKGRAEGESVAKAVKNFLTK